MLSIISSKIVTCSISDITSLWVVWWRVRSRSVPGIFTALFKRYSIQNKGKTARSWCWACTNGKYCYHHVQLHCTQCILLFCFSCAGLKSNAFLFSPYYHILDRCKAIRMLYLKYKTLILIIIMIIIVIIIIIIVVVIIVIIIIFTTIIIALWNCWSVTTG